MKTLIINIVSIYILIIGIACGKANPTSTEQEIFIWVGEYMEKDLKSYKIPTIHKVSRARLIEKSREISQKQTERLHLELGIEVAEWAIKEFTDNLLAFYNPKTQHIWIMLELKQGRIKVDGVVESYGKILAHEFVHFFQLRDVKNVGSMSPWSRDMIELRAYGISNEWEEAHK